MQAHRAARDYYDGRYALNHKIKLTMNHSSISFTVVVLAFLVAVPACGQAPSQTVTPSQSIQRPQELPKQSAMRALRDGEYQAAQKHAKQILEEDPSLDDQLFAADTLLRSGDSETAVIWFDRYVKERPRAKPYLWQRGIALYFVGRYSDAAQQFEVHREVNPHDVENAAWHYLCVARAESVEKADEMLLPAPNDPRPPMAEVQEMFRSGDSESVVKRMDSFEETSGSGKSARFYGDFYLGMYADAHGKIKLARKHLDRCAETAPRHYMGDIARVYAKHLSKHR